MRLFPEQYAATVAKVAKINKRAQQRGFTGRVAVRGERQVITNGSQFPHLPETAELVVFETTIEGDAPCYEGWEFLAALDMLRDAEGGAEWVVRCAPGVSDESVERSTLRPSACDHCNTYRDRRHLFLVRHHETGEYRQVGATCIKDFLGWDAMPVFLPADDLCDDSDRNSALHATPAFPPRFIVMVALATAAEYGWRPRSQASGMATADMMMPYLLGARRDSELAVIDAIEAHIPRADAQADEVIETVLTAFADAHSGYQANLKAILRAEFIEVAQLGLAASVVAAYQRILAATKTAPQIDGVAPQWLGAEGDKVEFTGTVTTAMTVDGYAYNTTQRLLVITTDTAVVKLYSTAGWTYEVDRGNTVTAAATIKKLNTWQNTKQTVVTRPKLLSLAD